MSTDHERFEMLYCDDVACRVNEFERGLPQERPNVPRPSGLCPACGSVGLPIPERRP